MTNERRFVSFNNYALTVYVSNYDKYLENLFEMFGDFNDIDEDIPKDFVDECKRRVEVTISSYEEAIDHFDSFLHFAEDFLRKYEFPEGSEYYEEDRQELLRIYEVFFEVIEKLKIKEECNFVIEGDECRLQIIE